ncbi:TRAP transporter large permease [Cognatishimia sp.]|uniref:TRAP transporter large permease n=1 Tax=Cognatishimia sp. TaxID=2211648 RepID=UPI0035128DA2|nr:TRAP transporter large permease [Cognatishimia sp.]
MISMTTLGILGLLALFGLLALRVPVALSMVLVGVVGTILATANRFLLLGMASEQAWARGIKTAMSNLSGETFEAASNYNLLVIPMFVLMGNLAGVSGMSADLFGAAYRWMGHLKGGLASATIAACAGFAALSGSSLAAAITMGRVALPEMKKFNYADSLATGSVAAGGTLGFLIPPSGGMIIYAVLTEQSIGRLFMAGVIPGILMTLLVIGAIYFTVLRKPEAGPSGEKASWPERRDALLAAFPFLAVVGITIGGMYTGFFTPVEASSVGAFLTLVVAIWRRSLNAAALREVILQTVKASATVFMIIIGAFIFIPFMSLTELPSQLVTLMTSLPIGDYGVLLLIILIYMFLGMFLEGIAMLVLTIPVVLPIIAALDFGFDPSMADMKMIWFGIIVVIVLEMGMISPPVGLNVFVVKSIAPGVPMGQIFRGIWPFWFAMALMLILLMIFPQIAIFLPQTMVG